MNRCEDCAKLFSAAPEKTLCDTCIRNRMSHTERVREAVEMQGLQSLSDIALAVGIPLDDVSAILDQLKIPSKDVSPDALCAHCRRQEATHGSSYCPECRATLDQLFGEAARSLERKIAADQQVRRAPTQGSSTNAREALDKKRLRTTDQGNSHFRR
jgi:Zn finger protein HypA/HybF involved in hydrogenase expression